MTTHNALLRAARLAHQCGISVLPPAQDGTKRPDSTSWKQYQKRHPTPAEIDHWYANGRTGIGWVTGYISGGLEVVDFDDRTIYREYKSLATKCGLGELVARVEAGYLEHSPNGAHWAWRVARVAGNTKLAQRADGKVLIETRGEGGYIITAPTYGDVNRAGKYELISGGVETIVGLKPDEREELFSLARTFDEKVQQKQAVPDTRHMPDTRHGDRPGDDFNARATWQEILEPHGWVLVYTRNGVGHWRRPDKKLGVSATTGHDEGDHFYVFSTSTEFEAGRQYDKFGTHMRLNHNGSVEDATAALRAEGFGEKREEVDPEQFAELIANARLKQKKTIEAAKFPEHLLNVPGAVGWLADWINDTSPMKQPILALGASLAAMSTIIGRKARDFSGLRSNLYVLGVADSGTGKERARQAIRALFTEIGAYRQVNTDDVASSAAIETALGTSPSSLFLLDEFGRKLRSLVDKNASLHVSEQKTILMKLMGCERGIYEGRKHGDSSKDVSIVQPCLSIYGTTVPDQFYRALGGESIEDGFFSRLLVFQSEDDNPVYNEISDEAAAVLPPRVVERFSEWHRRPYNIDPAAGDLERTGSTEIPTPTVVLATVPAKKVFEDLTLRMRELRAKLKRAGRRPAAFSRIPTMAKRLALVRACGEKFNEPEITRDCAVWACELAEYLVMAMVNMSEDHSAESEIEALIKLIERVIKGRGGTATKSQITTATKKFHPRLRDDALRTLVEGEEVLKTPLGGRGGGFNYAWIGDR
jgi:hypothetical protein